MSKVELMQKVAKLLDEYETRNNNCVVGCTLSFPDDRNIEYAWNGERFKECEPS